MSDYLDDLWERISGSRSDRVSLLHDTRRQFLTFTGILTVVIALIWVTLTASSVIGGRPLVAFACALAPLAFAPIPYLALRSNISLDTLSHAYLMTFFAIVTLTAATLGGAVSTTSFFLVLLPLLATLLLGIRVGITWVGVVALTFAALHFGRDLLPPSTYQSIGGAPGEWMRVEEVSLWNAAMMVLLALAASLSVGNFRAVVGKSSAMLIEAAHKTKDAREAQIAAEEFARSKSEFMANVSHELRTPLNAVIGYTEMLIESADDRGAPEDAEDNRKVLQAAFKLRRMINDTLKLAAIDAGKVPVETEPCRPSEIAHDAVEFARPFAHTKGAEIQLETAIAAGVWHMDAEKVSACIRDLLTNAAQCSAQGCIALRIAQNEGGETSRLVVEVSDDGPGIDPDRVEALFEPFSQPEDVGARHYEGMALSLALTRRVARLLGGELSVCGQAIGARFRLEIPARFVPDAR